MGKKGYLCYERVLYYALVVLLEVIFPSREVRGCVSWGKLKIDRAPTLICCDFSPLKQGIPWRVYYVKKTTGRAKPSLL